MHRLGMAGYGGVPFFDGAEGENFSASGPPFVSTTIERVPTSQHAIMSSAMLGAKRARMKVEADRQVLVNRISRLQSEEMKAVKRIEETHCRTQEVLAVKNRQQRAELDKRVRRPAHPNLHPYSHSHPTLTTHLSPSPSPSPSLTLTSHLSP